MMTKKNFIGRADELKTLNSLHKHKTPNLIVVKGRRRIGKSCLISQFAQHNPENQFWNFTGLAPQEGLNNQAQRNHFTKKLATLLNGPHTTFNDWGDIFDDLSSHVSNGDIILLDEISWMGSHDPSFIPKLKAWWDEQNKSVTVILCGSVSTWIEENILKSTAFFGRVNLTLELEPLSIKESAELLRENGFQGSDLDIYRLLSVLGGVPWYLEQVKGGQSTDEIIKALCFKKNGLLALEFEHIFHDLFGKKGRTYKNILHSLKEGHKTLAEIRKDIGLSHGGKLSQLMDNLIISGFVEKQQLWSLKTSSPLKQSLYRICDPYIRFYLKVIEKNLSKIQNNAFIDTALSQLPGFDSHIGLQIELLLLQNRRAILKEVGVHAQDVTSDGPYRQTKTASQRGCQIDYLIQSSTKTLFVCEFKFKRNEIKSDIIDEMKTKISALKIPKGFSAIPVLFHVSGVSANVETSEYFYRIIDITGFLR